VVRKLNNGTYELIETQIQQELEMRPMNLEKFAILNSGMTFVKALGIGIARFYACIILFNLTMWLTAYLRVKFMFHAIYEMKDQFVADIFLNFAIIGRGTSGLPTSFSGLLEAFLGPMLLMAAGVLALWKSRFQIIGANLILLSNFCLASLIIGLLLHELPLVFHICSLLFLLLLITSSTFWAFHRLFKGESGTWIDHLAAFASTFLFPSAIVSFFMVVYPPDSELIKLEVWLWIYWPIIAIAGTAVLCTTAKWRLSSLNFERR
jgi:hypothetical protein